jgi:GTPase SAR1 family protein
MECSARDNYNINELFKTLLALSKIIPNEQQIETNGGPLKRRSSAYVSASSKGENYLSFPWNLS